MYCNACGKAISDDARYCAYCGTVVGHPPAPKRLIRPRANRTPYLLHTSRTSNRRPTRRCSSRVRRRRRPHA